MVSIDVCNRYYSFACSINELEDIDGYPHMKRGIMDGGNVIIKELYCDGRRLDFLESVYSTIESIVGVNVPMKHCAGESILRTECNGVIIFEELKNPDKVVTAKWWAKILQAVHSLENFWQYKEVVIEDYLEEVDALLKSAQNYMESDIRCSVKQMLNKVNWKLTKKSRLVLNHGDPLCSNVMMKIDKLVLIDFESAKLAPKEYDIQRKLWDVAIEFDNVNDIIFFLNEFKSEYEKTEGIDMELLMELYIIDFCRTFCWLYIVSRDEKRYDYKRQKVECENFAKAVRDGRIEAVLRYIEKGVCCDGIKE